MILGATSYGPYGPPFKDPALQAAYQREARKLAGDSALITQATADSLVAAVINSTMAAVDAKTPEVEREAATAASRAARGSVGMLLTFTALAGVVVAGIAHGAR